MIPVVVGALGTVKKGMIENIKKVSERATVTEIQKICMLGSAQILRKVLSVWTEWLTWVTDAPGAWFVPGWCTTRTPTKTVIEKIIITIMKSLGGVAKETDTWHLFLMLFITYKIRVEKDAMFSARSEFIKLTSNNGLTFLAKAT